MSLLKAASLWAGGLSTFGVTFYFAYLLAKPQNKNKLKNRPVLENERREIFDKLSSTYDKCVRFDEWLIGIKKLRKNLISEAYGDVLEVAVGSGRNFEYYDNQKVSSLTLTDFSRPMLKVALQKKHLLEGIEKKTFKVSNALRMSFPDESFDCVVDTFGICSYEKPVESLKEISRVLKSDGRLLLLEHGVSSYNFLREYMNNNVDSHARRFGCFYNRNVLDIVEQAGFEIEELRRKTFGTTYFIVAKKKAVEKAS